MFRFTIGALALALINVACLDLAQPSTGGPGEPTSTPTATSAPTQTPTSVPPTQTSTVTPTITPTPTATPSPTPTFSSIVIDPRTGQPFVSAFPPPAGSVSAPGTGTAASSVAPPAAAGSGVAPSPRWGCDGDERLDFAPISPRVGEKLFMFVTGSRDRAFALIIGPGLSGVQGQAIDGGTGLKRRWEVTPARPGVYTYYFYGGPYPEHLCVSGSVEVLPGSITFTPLQSPTSTPRPVSAAPTPLPAPRPDH